ncbi:hypothetical protein EON80_27720, partial [bacterium]
QIGGATLREIKELLDNWGTDIDAVPRELLIERLETKIKEADEKIKRLQDVRTYMVNKLERAKTGQSLVGLKPPQ